MAWPARCVEDRHAILTTPGSDFEIEDAAA